MTPQPCGMAGLNAGMRPKGKRLRIADPVEAAALTDSTAKGDEALWTPATPAFRLGELLNHAVSARISPKAPAGIEPACEALQASA